MGPWPTGRSVCQRLLFQLTLNNVSLTNAFCNGNSSGDCLEVVCAIEDTHQEIKNVKTIRVSFQPLDMLMKPNDPKMNQSY